MFNLIIKGFKTKAQVEAFASWYNGEGEQNAYVWFECRRDEGEIDVRTMGVDSKKPMEWTSETDYEFYVNPR